MKLYKIGDDIRKWCRIGDDNLLTPWTKQAKKNYFSIVINMNIENYNLVVCEVTLLTLKLSIAKKKKNGNCEKVTRFWFMKI